MLQISHLTEITKHPIRSQPKCSLAELIYPNRYIKKFPHITETGIQRAEKKPINLVQ